MLVGAFEDAAEDRWPSVELPNVEGPKGSAGEGPAGVNTVLSERLHTENSTSKVCSGHFSAILPDDTR